MFYRGGRRTNRGGRAHRRRVRRRRRGFARGPLARPVVPRPAGCPVDFKAEVSSKMKYLKSYPACLYSPLPYSLIAKFGVITAENAHFKICDCVTYCLSTPPPPAGPRIKSCASRSGAHVEPEAEVAALPAAVLGRRPAPGVRNGRRVQDLMHLALRKCRLRCETAFSSPRTSLSPISTRGPSILSCE